MIGLLVLLIFGVISGIIYTLANKHSDEPATLTSLNEEAYFKLHAASTQDVKLDANERKILEKQANSLTATEKLNLDMYLQLAHQVNEEISTQ